MKKLFLIITGLLFCVVAFAQHHPAGAGAGHEKREPFYTKKGGRDIYHLYLTDTIVNYTGKPRHAMAINGTIPGPALEFTEGDTAEIWVHNEMKMETSIHWHGLLLPNRYDGVSYLTTAPIMPGETHYYTFPLIQHGTHWYHSHTMTQEQSGLYGAFIIHPKKTAAHKEYTLVLSDWTNENPKEVERSLHARTDWYSIEKGSVQSYGEALKKGYFGAKLTSEWKRGMAMDVSDVYYNRFFANGTPEARAPQFKPGDTVRLRVVNGSSSTYFWLNYSGGKMTVVANDGADVQPVKVDRLIIAAAETYDVLVTIPDKHSYELLATAEDRSNTTALWLGSGPKAKAMHLPKLNYFEGMKMMNGMMNMNGQMKTMDSMPMSNQTMDMNSMMYPELNMPAQDTGKKMMHKMPGMKMSNDDTAGMVTLNYGMLKAVKPTTLPPGPMKVLRFNLTGNMNRYVWSINNKTVSESDKVLIKKGENVRIILHNSTMMRHPMHLHGHFFRVLNGQGEYAPLKNTLDIMPMETDTIEFAATASGDWFFHCHILYHMMSGMGRVFSYENSPPNPELPDPAKSIKKIYADDRRFYLMGNIGLQSNGSSGNLNLENTRWRIETLWNLGLNNRRGYESETFAGRYFGQMQWLYVYAGFDYHYRRAHETEKNLFGQISDLNNRHTPMIGLAYTLPLFFVADARIDGNGKVRLQLSRDDIALSSRLRLALSANTDREYSAGMKYIITKYFSASANYDSDLGAGAGITLTY